MANIIHSLTRYPEFSRDFRLRDQILDAAGSVMHNIAEGSDAGTDPEFVRFLKMARRSASEIQSELYLALDRKYITEAELKQAYNQADEVKRLINGLIAYLRKNGKNAERRISESQADYILDNHHDVELPADFLSTGDATNYYQTDDY
ncbi:MAG: four helix bundle protein [Anaerolineales bacterium]|nr:four helix bundle protein [Anaerolineales bacterium]